jgi:hypothetical protein
MTRRRKRHSPEQIVHEPPDADAMLNPNLCRRPWPQRVSIVWTAPAAW